MKKLTCFLASVLLLAVSTAGAQITNVTQSTGPFADLDAAMLGAAAGDVLEVAGTAPSGTINLDNITVQGAVGATTDILTGVTAVAAGTTGVTIQGVRMTGGGPTLDIFADATVTVNDSVIDGSPNNGIRIAGPATTTLDLVNTTIENHTYHGINNNGATVTLTGCLVQNNGLANGLRGGLRTAVPGASFLVDSTTIQGNAMGIMHNANGTTVTVQNGSVIQNNGWDNGVDHAGAVAGGIIVYNPGAVTIVDNSTITANNFPTQPWITATLTTSESGILVAASAEDAVVIVRNGTAINGHSIAAIQAGATGTSVTVDGMTANHSGVDGIINNRNGANSTFMINDLVAAGTAGNGALFASASGSTWTVTNVDLNVVHWPVNVSAGVTDVTMTISDSTLTAGAFDAVAIGDNNVIPASNIDVTLTDCTLTAAQFGLKAGAGLSATTVEVNGGSITGAVQGIRLGHPNFDSTFNVNTTFNNVAVNSGGRPVYISHRDSTVDFVGGSINQTGGDRNIVFENVAAEKGGLTFNFDGTVFTGDAAFSRVVIDPAGGGQPDWNNVSMTFTGCTLDYTAASAGGIWTMDINGDNDGIDIILDGTSANNGQRGFQMGASTNSSLQIINGSSLDGIRVDAVANMGGGVRFRLEDSSINNANVGGVLVGPAGEIQITNSQILNANMGENQVVVNGSIASAGDGLDIVNSQISLTSPTAANVSLVRLENNVSNAVIDGTLLANSTGPAILMVGNNVGLTLQNNSLIQDCAFGVFMPATNSTLNVSDTGFLWTGVGGDPSMILQSGSALGNTINVDSSLFVGNGGGFAINSFPGAGDGNISFTQSTVYDVNGGVACDGMTTTTVNVERSLFVEFSGAGVVNNIASNTVTEDLNAFADATNSANGVSGTAVTSGGGSGTSADLNDVVCSTNIADFGTTFLHLFGSGTNPAVNVGGNAGVFAGLYPVACGDLAADVDDWMILNSR